jgi:hypothetical protein
VSCILARGVLSFSSVVVASDCSIEVVVGIVGDVGDVGGVDDAGGAGVSAVVADEMV